MAEWEFANKEVLWLLWALPILIGWYIWRYWRRQAEMGFSNTGAFAGLRSWKSWGLHLLFIFRLSAIAALVVALARPQTSSSTQSIQTEGIDIVIALDISGSMLAMDFKPDRLQAAINVAKEFIRARTNDRIGLVVYSGTSFTQCPLTTDHEKLINLFESVKFGMIEDGTAIGMGLANAVNRLEDSDAKSKVIILLTDGENNAGSIPPLTAAEVAAQKGIKVYTVGIGTRGKAPMPMMGMFGQSTVQMMPVNIDEETLTAIADITGGTYFRATTNEGLKQVYAEIDQMEKTVIEETEYTRKEEEYSPLALLALMLVLAEWVARKTLFKSAVSDV